MTKCDCEAKGGLKLIFSCSGASEVGEITDRAARKLTKDNIGKMFCLAGLGGKVSGIVRTTEAARKIVAIDGCPLSCAKKTLENSGITQFTHLPISEIGVNRSDAKIDDETINKVCDKVKQLLA